MYTLLETLCKKKAGARFQRTWKGAQAKSKWDNVLKSTPYGRHWLYIQQLQILYCSAAAFSSFSSLFFRLSVGRNLAASLLLGGNLLSMQIAGHVLLQLVPWQLSCFLPFEWSLMLRRFQYACIQCILLVCVEHVLVVWCFYLLGPLGSFENSVDARHRVRGRLMGEIYLI